MQNLIKALESKEMMDAYLELNKTEDIINEIRDYAETNVIKQQITGNEPASPFTAATENELLSGHITGLTIRQDLAARAMQGMAASAFWSENFTYKEGDLQKAMEVAVKAADTLIEALNK